MHTKGLISGAISDEQSINIGLDMRNLIYNKDLKLADDLQVYENRTTLALNPHYKLSSDSWNLRAGANVDLSFGSGKSFRVSPDVTAQYISPTATYSMRKLPEANWSTISADWKRSVLMPCRQPLFSIRTNS